MVQNEEKANTPNTVLQNVFDIHSDAPQHISPKTKNHHQHLVPQR